MDRHGQNTSYNIKEEDTNLLPFAITNIGFIYDDFKRVVFSTDLLPLKNTVMWTIEVEVFCYNSN